jgi:hypothetical protein
MDRKANTGGGENTDFLDDGSTVVEPTRKLLSTLPHVITIILVAILITLFSGSVERKPAMC